MNVQFKNQYMKIQHYQSNEIMKAEISPSVHHYAFPICYFEINNNRKYRLLKKVCQEQPKYVRTNPEDDLC